MKLARRVQDIHTSATQKLNEKINQLAQEGEFVYNLTSGQLPVHPPVELINALTTELKFLKSFQYSAVSGFPKLRDQLKDFYQEKRNLPFENLDCVISNGAKQSLYNVLGTIVEKGDEVIIISPYWVSFPAMIKFWGGVPVEFSSFAYDNYQPDLNKLMELINSKTKAIIINSPNNPTGVLYSENWMRSFAKMAKDFPDIVLVSDEIYSDLCYFDPKPQYFYQFAPELLSRTVIVNGISKTFAATGLRIGYTFAPKDIVKGMERIQSQTTSGANSLVQQALQNLNLNIAKDFQKKIAERLRRNAEFLQEKLRQNDLAHCWYQSTSAFYFLFDFSSTAFFKKTYNDSLKDHSEEICEQLFLEKKVALVPGAPFGAPNKGRMSLAFDEILFEEAITHIIDFCQLS